MRQANGYRGFGKGFGTVRSYKITAIKVFQSNSDDGRDAIVHQQVCQSKNIHWQSSH